MVVRLDERGERMEDEEWRILDDLSRDRLDNQKSLSESRSTGDMALLAVL
jgi:hypothetical protein